MGLGSSQITPEHLAASSIVSDITVSCMKIVLDNETVEEGEKRIDLQSITLAPHVNGDAVLLQQLSPRLMQEYKNYLQIIDESIFKAIATCASIAETPMSAKAITKNAIATAMTALIIEDM